MDVAHEARTELVGRERELSVVRDAFERARHERTPQLLTLVGVPGMGKSRLVYELSQIVDTDPELITWRQGRCLAYGDGVTLWALGEIVKAQAEIVEQDTLADVERKLRDAVADVLAETSDASWVESELRALVGLPGELELGGDRRGAAFAAWRRFLEAMAEQRPLVIVSKTFTGPTRACSTSWTSSSIGSRTSRCWSWQRRGPSSSSAGRDGAAAS